MPTAQEQFDEAMFAFSQGAYDAAIVILKELLAADSENFDAQLALGMAYYRKGDFATAIAEGHKAEAMRPQEQLVHTNLSLFYLKAGDKARAEHHGLQARISSWRGNLAPPGGGQSADSELELAKPPPPKPPPKLPKMPWKEKKPTAPAAAPTAKVDSADDPPGR